MSNGLGAFASGLATGLQSGFAMGNQIKKQKQDRADKIAKATRLAKQDHDKTIQDMSSDSIRLNKMYAGIGKYKSDGKGNVDGYNARVKAYKSAVAANQKKWSYIATTPAMDAEAQNIFGTLKPVNNISTLTKDGKSYTVESNEAGMIIANGQPTDISVTAAQNDINKGAGNYSFTDDGRAVYTPTQLEGSTEQPKGIEFGYSSDNFFSIKEDDKGYSTIYDKSGSPVRVKNSEANDYYSKGYTNQAPVKKKAFTNDFLYKGGDIISVKSQESLDKHLSDGWSPNAPKDKTAQTNKINASINKFKALQRAKELAMKRGDKTKVEDLDVKIQDQQDVMSSLGIASEPDKPSDVTTDGSNPVAKFDSVKDTYESGISGAIAPTEMNSNAKKVYYDKFPKAANNYADKSIKSIVSNLYSTDDNGVKTLSFDKNSDMSKMTKQIKANRQFVANNKAMSPQEKKAQLEKISNIEKAFVFQETGDLDKQFMDKYDNGTPEFRENIDGLMKNFYESEYTGIFKTFGDYITGKGAEDTFVEDVLIPLNQITVAETGKPLDMEELYGALKNNTFYQQKAWDVNAPFGLEEGEQVAQNPIIDRLKQVPKLRASTPTKDSVLMNGVKTAGKAVGGVIKDGASYIADEIKAANDQSFKERQAKLRRGLDALINHK